MMMLQSTSLKDHQCSQILDSNFKKSLIRSQVELHEVMNCFEKLSIDSYGEVEMVQNDAMHFALMVKEDIEPS